ncbi:MAG: indole-3-glycerol phosphate synthase TrpC [Phycisphaerales bacterium]|nr:indole-3-glycerol phosphate synthase TrpC [Phycisphaerales bacterium]
MPRDFLADIARLSAERVAAARRERDFEELWDAALDAPAPKPIAHGTFDLIAEVKTSSPSEGVLKPVAAEAAVGEAVKQATLYQAAGAAAISVLTEPSAFGGSLENLRAVAAAVDVPVMRKDFLVADYQIVEAREAGASGVLLIARMLSDDDLFEMIDLTRDLGMFYLVEAFHQADMNRLRRTLILRGGEFASGDHVGELLIGVNCRDLATLQVDPSRFEQLRPTIPAGYAAVAESGVATPEDAARAAKLGYNLALVGSSLMKAPDPESLATEMLHAARSASPKRS